MSAPWPPRSDADDRREAEERLGADLCARFAAVELLVLDVDGVLTGGEMLYGPGGEALKAFHSRDGLGLTMARIAGLKRAVLTGRDSAIVARRCGELRFDCLKLGRFDKQDALREILAETGCDAARTLYVGDDLIDLPAMHLVGLAVCVPDAPAEVADFCAWRTTARGGQGAVREVTDLVLKASGRFGLALTRLGDKAWRPRPDELTSDVKGGLPPEGVQ
ncbi:MAG TPA: HAD hydrolase family protein [Candidatus Krumholzibacteria bacterium]|nr:HAD hydrolase family protein [Candidatus Krumholzibacteria bacterium]